MGVPHHPGRDADLVLGPLSLWIHGYQFPDSNEYWDANWLRVTVRVSAEGSVVQTGGPIIHVPELIGFCEGLRSAYQTLRGGAELKCLEPNVAVSIKMGRAGHASMEVLITPDPLDQWHKFKFGTDQTYLGPALAACESILERFPLKGSPND